MTEKPEKPRISGKEATHVAMEAQKYGPVRIGATDDSTPNSDEDEKRKAQPNGPRLCQQTCNGRHGWAIGFFVGPVAHCIVLFTYASAAQATWLPNSRQRLPYAG